MQNGALVKKEEPAQAPAIVGLETLERAADYVVKSGLFGVTRKEQAIALMLLAQAEGIHPMKAIQEYHIIQGRPALKADAMLARFLKAGGKVTWHEISDKKCKATFEHPQGGKATIEWTIEMAKSAGLFDKQGSNWKKYPRAMLRARVISEGIRTVYPVVIVGTYTPEEVQDFAGETKVEPQVVVENGEIIDAETGEVVEEAPKWDITRIREVATEELRTLVKQYKVTAKELVDLFNEFNGDQEAIIKKILETRGVSQPQADPQEEKGNTVKPELQANGTNGSLFTQAKTKEKEVNHA